MTKKAPVIFHNLEGYDSHLIMQEVVKFNVKIIVTLNGLEKYMTFTVNKNLIFIDSMQFVNSSLDSLVKNFKDNDFKYFSQEVTDEQLKLLKQKGVYPYEYMDSFKKFSDDELPNRFELFSSLKDECISKKDYLHAINVWNMLKINTMDDYHDLYLKTDVLLLADFFTYLLIHD